MGLYDRLAKIEDAGVNFGDEANYGMIDLTPDDEAWRDSQIPTVSQAAPDIMEADDESVFCWRAITALTKEERLKPYNQSSVGSCVGNGAAGAANITIASDIIERKEFEEWEAKSAADALYGMSRQIVGQLGRWDGSNGSWVARAMREWGIPKMKNYDGIDLSAYSVSRCKEWAARGVPDTVRKAADPTKADKVYLVANAEEAWAVLGQFYGILICSNQGFTSQRDSEGFCRASGRWAHCMYLSGRIKTPKGRKGFNVPNSWGENWVSGPVWPEDQPSGSFNADWDVIDYILKQRDSYAVSDYQGIRRRKLDYFM